MGLQDVPRCQHLKVNGGQCGSPALRRRRKCYFHEGLRLDDEKFLADQFGNNRFVMPVLEDANAIQVGLMKVIQFLGSGRMEPKVAGLMLYALQTAASNLKNVKFEPEKPTDVVIDPKDVDRTCINGPQWYERDFEEQKEEKQQPEEKEEWIMAPDSAAGKDSAQDEAVASAENTPAQASPAAQASQPRPSARKRPEPVETEESMGPAQLLYRKMFGHDYIPGQSGTGIETGAG